MTKVKKPFTRPLLDSGTSVFTQPDARRAMAECKVTVSTKPPTNKVRPTRKR
jgi:hypothetical protein